MPGFCRDAPIRAAVVSHEQVLAGEGGAVPGLAFEGLEAHCTAGLEIERIGGADHWLHHQKPVEVAARIRQFIQHVEAP